jgi:vacuolar-type H+-ATPase subunit C/Vma6
MRLQARPDFAYGNTRLRARHGALLREADYQLLLGMDVDGLLGALEATPADTRAGDHDGLRRLHEAIRVQLSRSLAEMRSFYAGRAHELVDVLLGRFDIHNVVTVLRAHASTRAAEEALPALVDLGWLAGPIAHEILHQGELAAAVDLLARSTPASDQAAALRTGFAEYARTEDLAALELAVVAEHAARTSAMLSAAGSDAGTLLWFTRRAIDERNLLITLRMRDAPTGLAKAEDALLAGGAIPIADFGAALHASGRAPVVETLGRLGEGPWRTALQRWAASGDLLELERELACRRLSTAAALFVIGDPLSIDVPVAFTAASCRQARNLRLLAEASVRGIHPETVRRELFWPEAWT